MLYLAPGPEGVHGTAPGAPLGGRSQTVKRALRVLVPLVVLAEVVYAAISEPLRATSGGTARATRRRDVRDGLDRGSGDDTGGGSSGSARGEHLAPARSFQRLPNVHPNVSIKIDHVRDRRTVSRAARLLARSLLCDEP